MNSTSPALIRTIATVASFAYGVLLYLCGIRLGDGAKQLVAYLPGALGVVAVIFDKWVWRWRFVLPWVGRPLLAGTWLTTIKPSTESHIPAGGNRGPIEAAMVIEQSYFSLHVTQYTAESVSHSTGATIRRTGEGSNHSVLVFVYANEPKQEHRHRSMPHGGACELQVVAHAPRELEGRYWTNRLTAGDLELKFLNRRVSYSSLAQVKAAVQDTEDVG